MNRTRNEEYNILAPPFYAPNKAIVYCHGHEQTHDQDIQYGPMTDKFTALANAGYTVLIPQMKNTWGNQEAVDQLDRAMELLDIPKQVGLFSYGVGSLTALNWSRQNLAKTFAVALALPVLDVERKYELKEYHNEILEAYPNPFRQRTDLTQYREDWFPMTYSPGQLRNLKIRIWASENDWFGEIYDTARTWNGAGARKSTISLGNAGHDCAPIDPQEVVQFFDDCGGRVSGL